MCSGVAFVEIAPAWISLTARRVHTLVVVVTTNE